MSAARAIMAEWQPHTLEAALRYPEAFEALTPQLTPEVVMELVTSGYIDAPLPPDPGLFVDVGAVLDGTLEVPAPEVAPRTDGAHLFYRSAHNGLTGDPESGKSLLALSVAADELFNGGRVFWMDLDHNGAAAIIGKFRAWGVPEDVLRDRDRFLLCITDDRRMVDATVTHAIAHGFTMAVVDSVGELLSLYGASPDSEQDYTPVNRAVMAKLAAAGLCVISIDHMAKGAESRAYGATGTIAKKRAMDGAYYAVEVVRPFVPGQGGKSRMLLLKDRHGGVRASVKGGDKRPQIATFELIASGEDGTATHWKLHPPVGVEQVAQSDLDRVRELAPEQRSTVRNVKEALAISSERASLALRQYRELEPD